MLETKKLLMIIFPGGTSHNFVLKSLFNYTTTHQDKYKYEYHIYQLIIEDIDTQNEEVVGIIDLQTNKECRFQFNVRGGK